MDIKPYSISTISRWVSRYGTPILVLSPSRIRRAYRRLTGALPGVRMYYALKANNHPALVAQLDALGCSFDVSTIGEVDVVKACKVDMDRCIYTHPIKKPAEVAYAVESGLRLFVLDNEYQLPVLSPYKKQIRLLVRLAVHNDKCVADLSRKFGVTAADAIKLILLASGQGFETAGLSFHVGSQGLDPSKYVEGLNMCLDIAEAAGQKGVHLEIIDIGGGFPIRYKKGVPPIKRFCQPIRGHLTGYFGGYEIIAEPGRYLCGDAVTLVTQVTGKAMRNGKWWYYIDDGVYNSLSGRIYDHVDYPMEIFTKGETFPSVIAGPTCDSFDIVKKDIQLPLLDVGELLVFGCMGAYTSVSASNFNGYEKTPVIVLDELR